MFGSDETGEGGFELTEVGQAWSVSHYGDVGGYGEAAGHLCEELVDESKRWGRK